MLDIKENIQAIVPYIPYGILRRFTDKSSEEYKRINQIRGGVLFFDVVGFTRLILSMSSMGRVGTEILQELFFAYYTDLIYQIRRFGGIVYQFAGDSILVGLAAAEDEDDREVIHRMAQCALSIKLKLRKYAEYSLRGVEFNIRTRTGFAFGNYYEILLGNTDISFQSSIVGSTAKQAMLAQENASENEIFLSRECWGLLPDDAKGIQMGEFYNLLDLKRRVPSKNYSYEIPEQNLNAAYLKACTRFIAPALLKKVTKGVDAYFGEFRELSIIFIRIRGPEFDADVEQNVNQLNEFYIHAQKTCEDFGGFLSQADLSDKGNVLMALFGAPVAIENKESMACRLSLKLLEIQKNYKSISELQIGISTGTCYCGNLGSAVRKNYTAIGESVVLASRLMLEGRTTCINIDEKTADRVISEFEIESQGYASLKGIQSSQAVYKLVSEIAEIDKDIFTYANKFIGREKELLLLDKYLMVGIEKAAQITFLVGEAGVGKSRLAAEFCTRIRSPSVEIHSGICYSYEKNSPFFPWKDIFLDYFNINGSEAPENAIDKIDHELNKYEDIERMWATLLGLRMGILVPELLGTRELEPRQKNERIIQIIMSLFEARSSNIPLVFVIEDVHWADEYSMALVSRIASHSRKIRCMLLLISRPDTEVEHLIRRMGANVVSIAEFGRNDARVFLSEQLCQTEPNETIESEILEKTQGNAFFIESIVHSLREQNIISADSSGRYRIIEDNRGKILLPDTLRDVILARIDRLSESEQITLKAAAVIGRQFMFNILVELVPDEIRDNVYEYIRHLEILELTPLEGRHPLTYIFQHVIIRDVAYNTLLTATRKGLHFRLAGILERFYGAHSEDHASILARHCLAGGDISKAVHYTLVAARKARDEYANKDAILHYKKYLEIISVNASQKEPDEYYQALEELALVHRLVGNYEESITYLMECLNHYRERSDRARIRGGIGGIYQEKGDGAQAIQVLEEVMGQLGHRVPHTRLGVVLAILVQAFIRVIPGRMRFLKRLSSKKRILYRTKLDIMRMLVKIYYFGDAEKLALLGFIMINSGERLGEKDYLSIASSAYAIILVGIGMRRKSTYYNEIALECAAQCTSPMLLPLVLGRYGTHALFFNDLVFAAEREHDSASQFRKIGEMWELQTSLMLEATAYFLLSDFQSAEKIYREMGEIGEDLNAIQHQGWSKAWAPYCRYLLQSDDVEEIRTILLKGLELSELAGDIANQSVALMHLANIAVREGDAEEAARLAINTCERIWDFRVIIPFVQCSLVDAAEAALYALQKGVQSTSRDALLRVARKGSRRARMIGRLYPYLLGPGLRVSAGYAAYCGKRSKATRLFKAALRVLDNSPNRWERGVAYYDAGRYLNQNSYIEKARNIFQEIGAQAELNRMDREMRK